MKKIMILNGAGKKSGNTAALIKAFTEGAESSGNEVKEFYLQALNIHGCLDCQGGARKPKGDLYHCVQKDDMEQIIDCYHQSDVIVFASPVYWFTITGTLKTAIDRLYAVQRNQGFDAPKKDTVLLMTSGASPEMNPNPIHWYRTFSTMGWTDLGMVLGTGKTMEAKMLGKSIK